MISNTLEIDGVPAVISYDAEIDMFRGEFVGLSGGADFYADTVERLKAEGKKSLKVYLDMCVEEGIAPYRSYSGRFVVRVPPALHERAATVAKASNQSLNSIVEQAIEKFVE